MPPIAAPIFTLPVIIQTIKNVSSVPVIRHVTALAIDRLRLVFVIIGNTITCRALNQSVFVCPGHVFLWFHAYHSASCPCRQLF